MDDDLLFPLREYTGMFLGAIGDPSANVHLPHLEYHTGVEYRPYPAPSSILRYDRRTEGPAAVSMYVGSVPPLVPEQYLTWAIDTLLGEYATDAAGRSTQKGTHKVVLRSPHHLTVLSPPKGPVMGLMFDIRGALFLRTPEAVTAARRHLAVLHASHLPLDPRPSQQLVVFQRWARSDAGPRKPGLPYVVPVALA